MVLDSEIDMFTTTNQYIVSTLNKKDSRSTSVCLDSTDQGKTIITANKIYLQKYLSFYLLTFINGNI